jgi:hypothetical protein
MWLLSTSSGSVVYGAGTAALLLAIAVTWLSILMLQASPPPECRLGRELRPDRVVRSQRVRGMTDTVFSKLVT